jgi:hypothetical protein
MKAKEIIIIKHVFSNTFLGGWNDIVKHLVMECYYLLTGRNNMLYEIALCS